jgi:GNAT superfamily N-acetyltransferase
VDVDRLLRIAPAAVHDLPDLRRSLGQHHYFADRLARQEAGRGLLLAAWLAADPVGDVYLWCEPAEEPEVRHRLPGTPLLNHLEVLPALHRRGIGTRLVQTAERLLRERGHGRVALGVSPDNHDAVRLYEKLGYEEWPHPPVATAYEIFLPGGGRRRGREMCRIFVKPLQ